MIATNTKGIVLISLLLLTVGFNAAHAAEWQVTRTFQIGFQALNEVSGISRSQRFDDVFWMHNDSGDQARLFAMNREGEILFPKFLPFHGQKVVKGRRPWQGHRIDLAAHYDWEDIATDVDWIYVADTGNNGNARRDLGIYKIPDFEPGSIEKTRVIDYYPIRYPDQESFPATRWHFDSEALFIDGRYAYLLTKHRVAGRIDRFEAGSNLYRLDLEVKPREALLTKVDSSKTLFMVTAAELSPDGQRLAVLGARRLSVFLRPPVGDAWLQQPVESMDLEVSEVGQVEAVTWIDNGTLWVTSEAGRVFELAPPSSPP